MRKPKSTVRLMLASLWGWIALLALVTALGFLLADRFNSRVAGRLAGEGADAVATVTDMSVSHSTGANGRRSPRYYLHYSFTDAGGATHADRASVPYRLYATTAIGDRVPLRYWTADPSLSEIEIGGNARGAAKARIGALIAGALALWAGWRAYRPARDMVRLRERGVARRARVEAHLRPGGKRDKRPIFKAVWREPDGTAGETLGAAPALLPPVGSEITVFVDPDGRLPAVWEGDVTKG